MALPLLALAVALVLVLLVAVAAVLVKLVLWLSLSRTLLVVALAALYWFVASRRRCLARGFYSCSKLPMAAATAAEIETSDRGEHAAAIEPAANGAAAAAASPRMTKKKSQLDVAVDSSAAVEEAPVLLNADVQVAADQVAPDETAVAEDDIARAGVKVNPVRRRSMQLPAPLLVKMLGDASSPSLSATESEEDDEEEPTLTRSYASRSTVASPMRAAALAVSPAPPTSFGRKIRPRSSSSSSGFSVANRKRLLGSPVRQPQLHPQPHPHSSTSSSSSVATVRPNGMMTPVRNRRAATVTTNPSTGSSKSQNGNTHSSGGLIKRNAFARRSAASERELMQEKMAADGYWIGDFRLERQLVARRSFLSKDSGNDSGNNSARSSPRAV